MRHRFLRIHFTLLILCFTIQHSIFAQQKRADSLLLVLKTKLSDSTKMIVLAELCWEYGTTEKIKAIAYGNEALALAKQIKSKYGEAYVYNAIGTVYLRSSDYDMAIAEFKKCWQIREKLGNEKELAATLSKIAIAYYQKGDYKTALELNLRALAIFEKLNDNDALSLMYNNIAQLYEEMKQYDEALKYYTKTYDVALKSNNKYVMAFVLFASAQMEVKTNHYEKAIEKYEQSAKLYEETDAKENMAGVFNNIGLLYRKMNNNKKGLEYYTRALKVSDEIGDKNGVAFYMNNIGNCYADLKNYNKALMFQTDALKMARSTGVKAVIKQCYRSLSQLFADQANYKKAYEYNELFSQIKDSILNEESTKQIAEMQTKYETEKKENENQLLQQENSIKTLEIENNNGKIKTRNQTIFILIAVIIVVLIIVLWQISLVRIKKQKRELETEKKLQQDRERISRDLHDNVGGQLSYVLFSLEGKEESSSEKRLEKSVNLASALRGVTGNLRETIWALNQEKLTLKDLYDKLKLYTRNIFSYTNIKIQFNESIEKDELLNPAFALNLFRICQEIINNVFKHANASELYISVSRDTKTTIIIKDNGVGFLKIGSQNESYGFSNLKKRAEEINATLDIESKEGKGTIITVVV
ncbi:MAG: tetratricopeptide repeat protein [Bacteroidia bacterium]